MKRSIFINPAFIRNGVDNSNTQRRVVHINPLFLRRKKSEQKQNTTEQPPSKCDPYCIHPETIGKSEDDATLKTTAAPSLSSERGAQLLPATNITPKPKRNRVEKPKKKSVSNRLDNQNSVTVTPTCTPAKKNATITPVKHIAQPKLAPGSGIKRSLTLRRVTPIRLSKIPALRTKRHQLSWHTQMKSVVKTETPCPIFQRIGKCEAQVNGKCNKLHDKTLVAICQNFLRGECCNAECLLSHEISLSKMPVCKFYLQACCGRDNCPYLHKKLSDKSPFCMDFLRGYCKRAGKCDKRHEFLCPEFERSGVCHTKKCQYCAMKKEKERRKQEREARQLEKQQKWETAKLEKEKRKEEELSLKRRYFDESPPTAIEETVDCILIHSKRSKIGEQPAFIPF